MLYIRSFGSGQYQNSWTKRCWGSIRGNISGRASICKDILNSKDGVQAKLTGTGYNRQWTKIVW